MTEITDNARRQQVNQEILDRTQALTLEVACETMCEYCVGHRPGIEQEPRLTLGLWVHFVGGQPQHICYASPIRDLLAEVRRRIPALCDAPPAPTT